jgi:hypothetical protein
MPIPAIVYFVNNLDSSLSSEFWVCDEYIESSFSSAHHGLDCWVCCNT